MPRPVQVILTNRRAFFVRPFPVEELKKAFSYHPPGYQYVPSYREGGWDGYLTLFRYGSVGSGLFLEMREQLEEKLGRKFVVQDRREPPEFTQRKRGETEKKIRDYQRECFEAMVRASVNGGLVLNATGTGKTFIAGLYFGALKGAGLFVVDELTLLDQARKELEKVMREEVGEIGDGIFRPKRISVGTIQTVHRYRRNPKFQSWMNKLQAVIIDEVHLALNRRNFQTIAKIQPPVVFGLTATLGLKKKHVRMKAWELAGGEVFRYPLQRGLEEGFLAPGVAVTVEYEQVWTQRTWGNMYAQMAAYQKDYVSLVVESKGRNGLIERLVREGLRRGKHIIVLVVRRVHLKELSKRFRDVKHALIFGDKSRAERVELKDYFERGLTRLILTNQVFKKGIDIKKVDVIVDGAAMKSENDAVQKYGRGVRTCAGKNGLLYFDVSDKGNRFEKAGDSRRKALRSEGIPVYRVGAGVPVKKIFDAAERRLAALTVRRTVKT